ncbi:MAG TPA: hypothetical protein VL588_01825 [Bdellovibrionota bacterium]|nr:hypothetical protein [Bdellovibrionota bacterium]
MILFLAAPARAELHHLYRSTLIQAMGGAGISLADETTALWVNPAALGMVDKMKFYPGLADVDAAGNMITDYPALMQLTGNFTPSSINQLLGRNLYARAQTTPSIVAPGFGFGLLVDDQAAFYAKNQALPQVTLGDQLTYGLQAAVSFPFQRRRGRRSNGEFYIGASVKGMFRRGGYYRLPTATVIAASASGIAGLHQITGNTEFGLGVDLGALYVKRVNRKLTYRLATTYTDLGGTNFGGVAEDVRGSWTIGADAEYDMGSAKVIAAYDYSDLFQNFDWRLKNHLGMELRFPGFSIYAGLHQVYLTYGVGVNLWLVQVQAMSYAEELSTTAFQEPNRRFMVRAAVNIPL